MKHWNLKALFVSVVFLILLMPLTVYSAGKGKISLTNTQGKKGDQIIIDVELLENPGFISANLYLNYDMEMLKLTKVEDGGLLNGVSHSSQLTSPYCLAWINDLSPKNYTVTGKLAKLYFEVISGSAVETEISVEQDIIDENLKSVVFEISTSSIALNGGKKAESNQSSNGGSSNTSGQSSNRQGSQIAQSSQNSRSLQSGNAQQSTDGESDSKNRSSGAAAPADKQNISTDNSPTVREESVSDLSSARQAVTDANGDITAIKDLEQSFQYQTDNKLEEATQDSAVGGTPWIWIIILIVALSAVGAVVIILNKKHKIK